MVPRILVVEDEEIMRVTVVDHLRSLGWLVNEAANGTAALEQIKSNRYEVVLSDIRMPGMDGFEATRAIRGGTSGNAGTPIIALTANNMPGNRERCLAAGMDNFLPNPFSCPALLAAMADALTG